MCRRERLRSGGASASHKSLKVEDLQHGLVESVYTRAWSVGGATAPSFAQIGQPDGVPRSVTELAALCTNAVT